VPGLYYTLAYISGGGLNLRWFRDEIAAHEKLDAEARGENIYQALDRMAAQVPPGANRLLFLPHLSGRVCPGDPNTRGLFIGLSWSHSKAHLYRAILEALGYEYAYYLKIVRSLRPGLQVRETRVIGGGARLLNQSSPTSWVCPTHLNREEFAVLGSAIRLGMPLASSLTWPTRPTLLRLRGAFQYGAPLITSISLRRISAFRHWVVFDALHIRPCPFCMIGLH
jgi:xylulokinase